MATLQEKIDGIDARIAELQDLKRKHQEELTRMTSVLTSVSEADKEMAIQLHEEFCQKDHDGVPGGCCWQTLPDGTPDWTHPTNSHWLAKAKGYKKKGK